MTYHIFLWTKSKKAKKQMGLKTLFHSFPFRNLGVLSVRWNVQYKSILLLEYASTGAPSPHHCNRRSERHSLEITQMTPLAHCIIGSVVVNGVLPTKGTSVISHGERWERKEEEEIGGLFLFLPSVSPWKEDKDPMTQRRRASVRDEHKKFLSGPLQSKKSDPDNVASRRSKTMNRSRSLFHPSIFFMVLIGWLATPDDELVFSHSLQYNGGKSNQSG